MDTTISPSCLWAKIMIKSGNFVEWKLMPEIITYQDSIDQLIDQIIAEKNYRNLDSEVKAGLHKELKSRLLDQIDQAIVAAMPDNKIDELNDLLDRNPTASELDVKEILNSSGVDAQAIAIQTMLRFRDLYLGAAEPAHTKIDAASPSRPAIADTPDHEITALLSTPVDNDVASHPPAPPHSDETVASSSAPVT
jgi:hypothetical protein